MAHHASSKDWRIQTLAIALTAVMAGTAIPAFPAFASASSAEIKAIPHESRQDVGTYIHFEMKFSVNTGNPITAFVVTVDPGTSKQKVLMFDTQGQILPGSSPDFKGVSGHISFKGDGYYGPSSIEGMFMTQLVKSGLSVGTHPVIFEVRSGSTTLASDKTDFILKIPLDQEKANLKVLAMFGLEHTKKGDQTIKALVIAKNNGTKGSGPFDSTLYLSKHPVIDSSAVVVGDKNTGNIGAGDIKAIEFNGKVSVEKGTYYLIVQLDSNNNVVETHEDDNTLAKTLVVS